MKSGGEWRRILDCSNPGEFPAPCSKRYCLVFNVMVVMVEQWQRSMAGSREFLFSLSAPQHRATLALSYRSYCLATAPPLKRLEFTNFLFAKRKPRGLSEQLKKGPDLIDVCVCVQAMCVYRAQQQMGVCWASQSFCAMGFLTVQQEACALSRNPYQ